MFRIKLVRRKKRDDSWKVYKNQALDLIQEIVINNPGLSKYSYNQIKVRNQRTRWGSCSSKRNLNFNYRIVFLPYKLAEYLVIHEFCHLKEMNHSKKYWILVENLCPDYKNRQKELKKIKLRANGVLKL